MKTSYTQEQLLKLMQVELEEIKPGIPKLDMKTDLIAGLGLDSVQVLDMCSAIEDELDISIPVNRLGEVRTVGEMTSLLSQLLMED